MIIWFAVGHSFAAEFMTGARGWHDREALMWVVLDVLDDMG